MGTDTEKAWRIVADLGSKFGISYPGYSAEGSISDHPCNQWLKKSDPKLGLHRAGWFYLLPFTVARMAELADARDSKSRSL